MTVQIRQIRPSDYRPVIAVIDGWWTAARWPACSRACSSSTSPRPASPPNATAKWSASWSGSCRSHAWARRISISSASTRRSAAAAWVVSSTSASSLPPGSGGLQGSELVGVAHSAFVNGMAMGMRVAAGVALACAIGAVFALPPRRQPEAAGLTGPASAALVPAA